MRKLVLLIVAVLMMTAQAFAQSQQVTGTVSSSNGEPIAGVTVIIKGTQTGVYTDGKGNFNINSPSDATLSFSITGKLDQEVYVGNKTNISVTMMDSVHQIDDVIVSGGYGSGKKAGTVIGSVDVIGSEKFAVKPSMNVMDALQGQVAGLNIMTSSGAPNATPSIRLHGVGSIGSSNEPLVILDGSAITLGTLMMMNPSDFESIVLLKDASATSIYGARAANGVIYVVSKKGRRDSGETAVVTFRTQYSMSNAVRAKLKGLSTDAYVDHMLEVSNYLIGEGKQPIIDQATADEYKTYGNTDWHKQIFRNNAPMIQTDLSVSGGGKKSSYYISGTYNDTQSVIRGADMKRYTFRANIEVTPKEWFKTGLALSTGYSSMANAYRSGSGGAYLTAPAMGAIMIPSYQQTHDKFGELYKELPFASNLVSPLYMHTLLPNKQTRLQINGALFAEIKPVKGLTLRSNLGLNAVDYRTSSGMLPDVTQNGMSGNALESFERSYNWTLTNTAEYIHSFNREHAFSVLVGQESIYNDTELFAVNMKGITDEDFLLISKGNELSSTPSYGIGQSTFNSLFARADYNYKERYFVDFSVRNDGSSRFGSNNRHATFYAVGAMWNLKNENFLKDNSTLSRLSLKASYGTQGNASIGDYSQYDTFGGVKYMGEIGLAPSATGNKDLTWEKQTKLTIGVNAELYSVVRLNVEFYNRKTTDMLMNVPNFAATGFSSKVMNVGSMKNTGIDVTINADLFKNKDWYVNIGTTFNYNKNKITELFSGEQEMLFGATYLIVGETMQTYKTYEWRGVDTNTGLPQWTDASGGITNIFADADLVNTKKSPYAPYLGGVSFIASWKGIALSADMSWQAGRWMLNNTTYFSENVSQLGRVNQSEGALDYWKKPGDKTMYPSLEAQFNSSKQLDSHLIENASFIRLKNLQISYTIPRKIVQKTKVFDGIKVWVGARNLLTWTNFRGLDPEVDSSVAMDNYPNTRQVTFGIEVQF